MSAFKKINDSCGDLDDVKLIERSVQTFCKQMLQGRIFIGTFLEKRYVEPLNAYRDVVSITNDEREFIHDLTVVKKRVERFYTKNHWVGVTSPDVIGAPASNCIWVQLSEEQVFGSYWFKVKTVKFNENEVFLKVKIIRSVNIINETSTEECKSPKKVISNEELSFADVRSKIISTLESFFASVVTLHNTKEAVIFISVLVAAIFTGSIRLMQYLCDFFLKFMKEFSEFMKSVTPILIALINLIGKSIFGLYMLIGMMWTGRKPSDLLNRPRQPMLMYNPQPDSFRRRRSGLTITELE